MRQPGFSHIEDTKEWLQFFKTKVALANLRILKIIGQGMRFHPDESTIHPYHTDDEKLSEFLNS